MMGLLMHRYSCHWSCLLCGAESCCSPFSVYSTLESTMGTRFLTPANSVYLRLPPLSHWAIVQVRCGSLPRAGHTSGICTAVCFLLASCPTLGLFHLAIIPVTWPHTSCQPFRSLQQDRDTHKNTTLPFLVSQFYFSLLIDMQKRFVLLYNCLLLGFKLNVPIHDTYFLSVPIHVSRILGHALLQL